MVYDFDPNMQPDSEFVDGELKHLAPGNSARMLDARRTPIRIVGIRLEPGFFVAEVLEVEDKGARWELPLEWAGSFQFARDGAEASPADVAAYSDAIARLDQPLSIPVDPVAREATEARIGSLRPAISAWLDAESGLVTSGVAADLKFPTGMPELWGDVRRYMTSLGLWDLEDGFATSHVSNPYAGEMVKGHSVVLAELGLVPFEGRRIRDSATFSEPFTQRRRAEHIVHRLALLRELFDRLGRSTVVLYRGLAFSGPARERTRDSFTSATFNREVATELFEDRGASDNGLLIRQSVPTTRLFMTYLETEQLNRRYSESEAILLSDAANDLF
jgi:hypothetical protein